MKFQNYIIINFERTKGRTDEPKAIFGGIIMLK